MTRPRIILAVSIALAVVTGFGIGVRAAETCTPQVGPLQPGWNSFGVCTFGIEDPDSTDPGYAVSGYPLALKVCGGGACATQPLFPGGIGACSWGGWSCLGRTGAEVNDEEVTPSVTDEPGRVVGLPNVCVGTTCTPSSVTVPNKKVTVGSQPSSATLYVNGTATPLPGVPAICVSTSGSCTGGVSAGGFASAS